jgi:hypothetical protein
MCIFVKRWSGNVGSMGRIFAIKHERSRWEDLGVDRRIILKIIFNKYDESFWIGLI